MLRVGDSRMFPDPRRSRVVGACGCPETRRGREAEFDGGVARVILVPTHPPRFATPPPGPASRVPGAHLRRPGAQAAQAAVRRLKGSSQSVAAAATSNASPNWASDSGASRITSATPGRSSAAKTTKSVPTAIQGSARLSR